MFDIAPSSCWRANMSLAVEPRAVRRKLNWLMMKANEGRESDGSLASPPQGGGEGMAGEAPSAPRDAVTGIAWHEEARRESRSRDVAL